MEIIRVHAKVLLENPVDTFSLTVRLRVESRRKVLLDVELEADVAPEGRRKEASAVGDNVLGEAMKSMDVLLEDPGEVRGGVGGHAGDEVGHLGEAADDNENGVVAVGDRKFHDVIERDRGPGSFRNGQWLEKTVRPMSRRFGALA